jgi:hypothetical protein
MARRTWRRTIDHGYPRSGMRERAAWLSDTHVTQSYVAVWRVTIPMS